MRYFEKLQSRISETQSRLCIGLDPRLELSNGVDSISDQFKQIIDETSEYAAAFKPNIAYFEAMGVKGFEVLEQLIKHIPKEVPIILDAKRSDIGETQKYYAQSYFENWDVDAVTLNPFLGYDTLEPFLDYPGKGVYLLAVTSNAGSADFQHQKVGGKYIYKMVQELAEKAVSQKKKTDVGLVVGLTNAKKEVMEAVIDTPLLVPGLGAQGGDVDLMKMQSSKVPTLINVSRGILYMNPEISYAQKAKQWAEKIAAI